VIVCVVLKSFSQNHLSKMCTAMKKQYVNFFENFETDLAQICADLLEIRNGKKKSNEHGP
jgi:succinate dehydrogenase flavin-adding protein (antitoxin of CptAB toxin-antitoxin module)